MDSIGYFVIIFLVTLLVGISKGGMGAVLAVLATPLLSMVMPVPHAVSTALLLLLFGDVFAIWAFWKKWDMHYIRIMLPMAMLGILIGTYLLLTLPDLALRRILAVFTLLFIVYRLLDYRIKALDYQPRDWHGALAGIISGIGSAVANVGAPAFTIYLLLQQVSPLTFVGTLTLFFAVLNTFRLTVLLIAYNLLGIERALFDLNDLGRVAWALPLIPIGVWVGRRLVHRIPRLAFERFMLFVLFVASLALLFISPR